MMSTALSLKNLFVRVEGKDVVHDASLDIDSGEIHALMGPNGSGKSSLAYAIAGHPAYEIASGCVFLGDEDITHLNPEERARRGLFLSFQEPPEVGGVSMDVFLKTISCESRARGDQGMDISEIARRLDIAGTFFQRFLNEGFSGGEKKKSELLQFFVRRPRFAILDEIDTGLDVDALRAVSAIIRKQAEEGCGVLLISHSTRLLKKVNPDFVHVLLDGKMAARGGSDMLDRLEARGYQAFKTP